VTIPELLRSKEG